MAGSAAAAMSGPVGAVIGAGVGVGADFVLSKGVELVNRKAFEEDVAVALRTAQTEWHDQVVAELIRVVDVWMDDAVQLLLNAVDLTSSARPAGAVMADSGHPSSNR